MTVLTHWNLLIRDWDLFVNLLFKKNVWLILSVKYLILFCVTELENFTNKLTLVQPYHCPWNSERIGIVLYILGQGAGNYTDKIIQTKTMNKYCLKLLLNAIKGKISQKLT